jgi:23S rRNA (cytosine1962-C5)-methyltransferase
MTTAAAAQAALRKHMSHEAPVRETAPGFGTAMVVLRPHKATAAISRHPWVFESAIDRIVGDAADGDVVDVVSDKNRFVARGIINSRSRLRIRLYTWGAGQPLDQAFFRGRLAGAVRWRQTLGYDDVRGAARLVFSEGDGLSGLVVDRYARHVVVQLNALATTMRWESLMAALVEELTPASIIVRSEPGIAKAEGVNPPQGLVWGQLPDGPVFIEEHGVRYGVDLWTGQKTGFYLDQRENRRAAAGYLGGRRVLDLFCYSGGFSLAAMMRGGAREALGIEKALAMAVANAELNGLRNVHFEQRDCFTALDELHAAGQRFGAVILDPPKFTRTRRNVNEALRAYHRINRLALELLEPEGILVTCSCSGSVTREEFLAMLSGAAQKSGREVQVLEQRGASPDHPVNLLCPETQYLKCFVCRVC